MNLFVGIDIGSTTVKIVILDEENNILFTSYERHLSFVRQKTVEILRSASDILEKHPLKVTVTGSAGQGVAQVCELPFMQEVFVTGEMVKRLFPKTDCVIELGGEDAKILFLTGGLEERMNGSCAGGTGAFIDQMASLLNMTSSELDKISEDADRIYTIASRCGVFAKSDIQPLLNQGAKKENIAASIFQAVVDQTITGLAQGRKIEGNILFLGGPLFFFKGLRKRFVETLHLTEETALFPDIAPYAVALGASLAASDSDKIYSPDELFKLLTDSVEQRSNDTDTKPIFESEDEYIKFKERHAANTLPSVDIEEYKMRNSKKKKKAYLGIDCGSTTTKIIILSEDKEIVYSYYSSNKGNPVSIVREELKNILAVCGDEIEIVSSAVTGYGEEIIKSAFSIDFGIVETVAHFKAAKHFENNVSFILDVGGQDIKCFKIKNNAIDSIILNEACSSGCGSFIETFAKSMGYSIEEFCKFGLYAKNPVDLGSRCTVFMNSSVKQAQKDGAEIGDISAGLSMSVVKNALYKVIRIHDASELGENVVVQGGTFLNDVILRSFETEIGKNVTRPEISGLMGAFGAALYSMENSKGKSTLIGKDSLKNFEHKSVTSNCGLCTNKCCITINTFTSSESGEKARKYISGNKCERPLGIKENEGIPNLYQFKLNLLKEIAAAPNPNKAVERKIGIPLGLNMFELLPFWKALWNNLGFDIVTSDISSRDLYQQGQHSIPSDTVCYPAKLMHGHIENLIEKGIKDIFYPCMTYNVDESEKTGATNHYNCPVVAYYPELLKSNMHKLDNVNFMMPYFDISNKKLFVKSFVKFLNQSKLLSYEIKILKAAIESAYKAQTEFMKAITDEGKKALSYAKEKNLKTVVLCGRPYHADPEINHGIDKLLNSFGLVIITEEVASELLNAPPNTKILNQWTYHSRLYNSAYFVAENKNMELVQLVSFGCGIDAITTDEIREILEKKNKLYTQLKIDEINNLGTAKIRIRSMLEATRI